jgi:DNA invertase Pin-like site-specific DNA recombinase
MKIVAYYRVSTRKQGDSGLGLGGQKTDLDTFKVRNDGQIIAEYTEVESGKRKDRPELAKAIAHAKRSRAKLVIAKLDRLARNVAFVSALMESGCDFVCCDNPHATPLTIHILAAVAEDEAKRISERTRKALAFARDKKGVLLGSARRGHWQGREAARQRGAIAGGIAAAKMHSEAADSAYCDLYGPLAELRGKGLSFQAIADGLNEQGQTTRTGKAWNPSQVLRVLRRAVA